MSVKGGLKLREWTLTEKTVLNIAGVNNDGVKFCELAILSIMY